MRVRITWSLLAILLSSPGFSQDAAPIEREALEAAKSVEPQVRRLAVELWKYSETAQREHRSAGLSF